MAILVTSMTILVMTDSLATMVMTPCTEWKVMTKRVVALGMTT
jgi:hypothetical protein